MSLTPDVIRQARTLLEAGRTKEVTRYLRKTLRLSSRDAKALLSLLEQEIAADRKNPSTPYVLSDMDNVLMPIVANALLGKNDAVAAIQCIKSHRNISLEECLDLMEETRRRFSAQYKNAPKTREASFGFGRLMLIPIAIGIAFSAFAIYKFIAHQRLISNSESVFGKVVDMHVQHGKAGGGKYAPIIEYSRNGKIYTHQSGIHSGNSPYYVGEVVPLFVDRDRPDQVIIDTFTDRWMVTSITGLLGIGFLFVPGLLMFSEYRSSRRYYG